MDTLIGNHDDATEFAVINVIWDEIDSMEADAGNIDFPLDFQKKELRARLTSLLDRLLARASVGGNSNDEDDDAAGDIEKMANEIRAKSAFGRRLAERLYGIDIDILEPHLPGAEYLALLGDRAGRYHAAHGDDQDGPRDNSDENSHMEGSAEPELPCVCCVEVFTLQDTVTLACSHHYCHTCLTNFFRRTLTDESIFPPKCCNGPIPCDNEEIGAVLGQDLVAEFQEKKIEYETQDRTYCHVPECAAFIPARHINTENNEVGICPRCQATTCTLCKAAAHQGSDCPQDERTRAILRLAGQEGWRQCFSCHRIVELNTGCYHISKYSNSLLPHLIER